MQPNFPNNLGTRISAGLGPEITFYSFLIFHEGKCDCCRENVNQKIYTTAGEGGQQDANLNGLAHRQNERAIAVVSRNNGLNSSKWPTALMKLIQLCEFKRGSKYAIKPTATLFMLSDLASHCLEITHSV